VTTGVDAAAVAASIAELTCYPVKGCAGTGVRRCVVTESGVAGDRGLMVVDATDGTFLSQRRLPGMAVIRPALDPDGQRLSLSAPGVEELSVEVLPDGPHRPVSLFGVWFGAGVDQGEPVADWLSTVLGRPARLVRVPPGHDRMGTGERTGPIGFADSTAVLICSLSSVDLLNERIAERGGQPVPVNRFRPNLVVSGWPEPHTEDRVRRMTVGGAEFAYAKRCVRCPVPTIDQDTGRWDGPEPTRTLAGYRKEPGGGVSFGMKAMVLRPGPVAVGDPVTVSEWA
jgi:uncharacterized protein YcbX